ncbi:MAG: cytochrome b [Porticoccaceae bacterium]
MTIRNTENSWGWLGKLLHWLTALLIFIQIPLGYYAEELKLSPLKLDLFVWHKSIGMLVLLLAAVRLLWRITGTIPISLDSSKVQRRLAQLAHTLLYGLMIALPISGWIITSAANIPTKLFWLVELPAIAGPDETLKSMAAEVHEICVTMLIIILVAHIGAALRHHFILRDSILKRMWF